MGSGGDQTLGGDLDVCEPVDSGGLMELEGASSTDHSSSILQTINQFRQSSTQDGGSKKKQRQWQVLLFGQFIAIAAASVNASSYTLEYNLGVVLPIFQMSIMYMILSSYLCCRGGNSHDDDDDHVKCSLNEADDDIAVRPIEPSPNPTQACYTLPILKLKLRIPWWTYFLMSLLDVEANYMVLVSLKFTSLTSTTLLGSLTVPSVMICSRYILARHFFKHHYVGVCLCLLGGTVMVWSDLLGNDDDTSSSEVDQHPDSSLGDLLAITAALLYGLGDTVAEYAIKHIDRAEYLGMLGLFGFLISIPQFCVLEWNALMDLLYETASATQHKAVATMVWYIVSLVFYYIGASYFLTWSDATLLNLSLQTTSLWASVFSVVADGTIPPLVFFLAAVLVTSGVCVYEIGGGKRRIRIPAEEEDVSSESDESETLTPNTSDRNGGYMSIEMKV